MILRRVVPEAARLAHLALIPMALVLTLAGCSNREPTRAPDAPAPPGRIEVVGTLVALKDDRPADGGIDLTLETDQGARELVRVPSSFIAGPRDPVRAMQEVVDAAKIGDRLRALGTRDESGALRPEVLELIPTPGR